MPPPLLTITEKISRDDGWTGVRHVERTLRTTDPTTKTVVLTDDAPALAAGGAAVEDVLMFRAYLTRRDDFTESSQSRVERADDGVLPGVHRTRRGDQAALGRSRAERVIRHGRCRRGAKESL